MSTKLYVVAHKDFVMPTDSKLYVPIMVGNGYSEVPSNGVTDQSGDNIAHKNPRYNELTALYWIWKNSDADVVGLCHYRRYFTTMSGKALNLLTGKVSGFIDEKYIHNKLFKNDIIVHNKTYFKKGGNANQLADVLEMHNKDGVVDLMTLSKRVFVQCYPELEDVYQRVLYEGNKAHLLNVMIARKCDVDRYCEWLFNYLFRLEEEIDKVYPGEEMPRALGMIAERMLDIWIEKEKMKTAECFTVNTERIDWKMWGN